MSAPACYVIEASDWHQFMSALGLAFFACFALAWAMSVDWHANYDLLRLHMRRRRVRRSRQARAA